MNNILVALINFQTALNAQFGFSEDVTVTVGKDTYRMFQVEAVKMAKVQGMETSSITDFALQGPDGTKIMIVGVAIVEKKG